MEVSKEFIGRAQSDGSSKAHRKPSAVFPNRSAATP